MSRQPRMAHPEGYVLIWSPGHPQKISGGYALEHVLVAEKAMGRYLPPKAIVHHVNEIRSDNRNENLVVCQDRAYHILLHARLRVLRAGGNPNTDQVCTACKAVLPFAAFRRKGGECKPCHALDQRDRFRRVNNIPGCDWRK